MHSRMRPVHNPLAAPPGGVNMAQFGLLAVKAGGINRLLRSSQSRLGALPGGVNPPGARGRSVRMEFANLPHDFAETLELVFVGITIVASLGILVAFGHWWQR